MVETFFCYKICVEYIVRDIYIYKTKQMLLLS